MFTRSAIFKGKINLGCEAEFYAAVQLRLIPAWSQMLHAQAVRVYRPRQSEPEAADVFLIQQIDYPSLEAIAEALQSDRRLLAMQAVSSVKHLYEGKHHHIIYERL